MFSHSAFDSCIRALFSSCGKTIRQLSVGWSVAGPPLVYDMLDRCPALEHLSAGDFVFNQARHGRGYPSVRSADILHLKDEDTLSAVVVVEKLKSSMPALSRYRLVPIGLAAFLVWPPPDFAGEIASNAVRGELLQVDAVFDPLTGSLFDELFVQPAPNDEDDEQDGDYQPSSESCSSSDSDSEDGYTSEEGEQELASEEVLAIFRRTLEEGGEDDSEEDLEDADVEE
ncbi:hypothetical protein C8F01DRAFT_1167344 [Mycena amicta]|nr:hypothetical protein C8F01DRAFT_1167344 [Mycena amicta]